MENFLRGSGNAGLRGAAVWAGKIGLLAAGAAAAAAAARAAAPRVAALVGGGGAALPGAWAAARAWLVPPYLFITVHLIILVIWGLSDHKLHRDHSAPAAPTQEAAEEPAPKPRDLARKPTPEPWREDPAPPPESSQSSCVTTESDEGSTASSRVLGLKRSVRPSPGSFIRVEEEEEEERKEEREGEGEGDADNQSMDATWRAIMARSSAAAAPAPPAKEDAAPRREAAAAGGGDEWTRRFEEFIRRNHDQIRLPREEMMMKKNQKMR